MNSIVSLLPASWQPKAKAVIGALGFVLSIVVAAVPDLPKWLLVVVAGLTAAGVYGTPAPGYVPPTNPEPTNPALP